MFEDPPVVNMFLSSSTVSMPFFFAGLAPFPALDLGLAPPSPALLLDVAPPNSILCICSRICSFSLLSSNSSIRMAVSTVCVSFLADPGAMTSPSSSSIVTMA